MTGLMRLTNQHLALAVTATTTLVFLLKILKVSDWEVTTAVAVVSAAPAPSLLFGLAVSVLPLVVNFLLALGLAIVLDRRRSGTPMTWRLLSILGVVAALSYYAVPLIYLLGTGLLFLVATAGRRSLPRAESTPEAYPRSGFDQILLALMPLAILLLVLIPEPWSAERITLSNGETLIGFVLDDEGQWVTILDAEDRLVSRVRSSNVRTREVCEWQVGAALPLDEPIGVLLKNRQLAAC